MMIDSMYIHIPFCRKICSYCDFCKMLYDKNFVSKYFPILEKEIFDKYNGELINTLYIGGGTPSCIDESDFFCLKNIIEKINLSDTCEITFECNIYDINEELLNNLKKLKVNRLSIGIESFDKNNLELMNRFCDYVDVENKMRLCRKMGFDNINLDLIYALCFEKFDTLKKDVKYLLKLKPEHISTYSLILEDNTPLKIKGYKNIDEELDLKMYNYICKMLKRNHYKHYEVSNFALPGHESKHNLNCWNNKEYFGFGLGAAGYYAGVRYQNTRNLTKYLNDKYVQDEEIVSQETKMKYELMLGLRKLDGIDVNEFYEKYNVPIEEAFNIDECLRHKDLLFKNNHLFINPKKIYVMNEILLKII